mgnify:CR=1 FL=1
MIEPFKHLDTIDVSEIITVLKNDITENDWLEDTSRSDTFEVHKDTHMLKVLWDIDFKEKVGQKHERNYNLFNFDKIIKTLTRIYNYHYEKGEIVRILFARLNPYSEIPPHIDGGIALEKCHRTHIPIITNEKNVFKVGIEVRHLKVGEIWEIDNTMQHAVRNNSEESRVHLIIDYLEDTNEIVV